MAISKADIIAQLQKDIFNLQGFSNKLHPAAGAIQLGPINQAFPGNSFPLGAMHEFIIASSEDATVTSSFVAGLLAPLMKDGGVAIWIGACRNIFPPALQSFGIAPDKMIFIDVQKEREILWAMEEALHCEGLAAVVGEIPQLNFTSSRRLQLAVEQSRVTGFILRHHPRSLATTACVTRWQITSLPSELPGKMPGIGFPRWSVALLKVRNGRPGNWQLEFKAGRFHPVYTLAAIAGQQQRKQGSMSKRFVSIWFPSLTTDWLIRRQPALKETAFVLAAPDHGRMLITAASKQALQQSIYPGMALADARAILPALQYFDDDPVRTAKALYGLAEWCIRFTPAVTIDGNDGLLLDASGCAHLWSGEQQYLAAISKRLTGLGYAVQVGMADTIGAAWAITRFGKEDRIIISGMQCNVLLSLPLAALRLEPGIAEQLQKLGLRQIGQFIHIPPASLRRRFGQSVLNRLNQALGTEEDTIIPIHPVVPYHERLPCLEPIATATGIEIALQRLLEMVCQRLVKEQKGLRTALFKCYRVDGKMEEVDIGTNHPSANSKHLFKLFENKLCTIEPALGIELFILEAPKVEDCNAVQEKLWETKGGLNDIGVAELLDRLAGKLTKAQILRYTPAEHYWPERSFKPVTTLQQQLQTNWKATRPRPLQLLQQPALIQVAAPVPDYPPMNFRYRGKLHIIKKADGPERIEAEWWLQDGQHRDYYYVEDEEGSRYWLFRLGHYDEEKTYKWFMHGFFA